MNLRNSLEYLQKTYGIYKYGLRTFSDFNISYILSQNLMTVPVATGEFESVLINIGDVSKLQNRGNTDTEFREGTLVDYTNSMYVVNVLNLIDINTLSMFNKEIDGNIIRIYSIENSMKETNTAPQTHYDPISKKWSYGNAYRQEMMQVGGYAGQNRIKYAYNHLNNEYVENEFLKNTMNDNIIINIPFDDLDISMFTPNKRFIIRFLEDTWKNYNIDVYNVSNSDVYKITKVIYGFNSLNKSESMSLQGVCQFRKATYQ